MSEAARIKASETWKAKLTEMKLAIRKRVIPRDPLEAMPVATPALLFANAQTQLSNSTNDGGENLGLSQRTPKTPQSVESLSDNTEIKLTDCSAVSSSCLGGVINQSLDRASLLRATSRHPNNNQEAGFICAR